MINIVICGINGAMGNIIKKELENYNEIKYIGSLSPKNKNYGESIVEIPHVIIDFSHPSNLDFILKYAVEKDCALLICTTGYSEEEKIKIKETSKLIPIMLSSNTSLGINIFRKILKNISLELNSFDIDILEKHHNKKIDSPSGTAKTLCQDIKEQTGRKEINISAIRAGTMPGEHTVIFSGQDEILEIKHTALSKRIFAKGALELALKLYNKPAAFYEEL